ncbi:MAG TPA: sugar ABC transporter permease [Burkholderiales bacterium]|nr:sugar ABC transporter permease [Burkholderiales bacterium]
MAIPTLPRSGEPSPSAIKTIDFDTAHRRSQSWTPYLFLSPFIFLFAIFGLFPLLFSLYLAFQSWEPTSGLANMKFVGFENFQFVLTDPWYWASLWNTFWLAVVSGVPQHLVAIPLAYFIQTSFTRWRNGIVGLYFLPYITSTVAIVLMFSTLFSTDYGFINIVLNKLATVPVIGVLFPAEKIDWLNRAEYIKPAVALVIFWRYVGFNTVLYLAALQSIPKELYEAAMMDGATKWQQFRYVTLPLLRPMIMLAVTLSVIGGMQLFEEPFILTSGRGGTDQSAMTTAVYMYRTAFEFNELGTASAISWSLFVIIAALIWLSRKLLSRDGATNASAGAA